MDDNLTNHSSYDDHSLSPEDRDVADEDRLTDIGLSEADPINEQFLANIVEDDCEVFNTFDISQWLSWINSFLEAEPCTPELLVGNEEAHLVLRGVYNLLGGDLNRDQFAEAVSQLFEATVAIPQNCERLYQLIRSIAYLKPRSAKVIIEQELYSRTLVELSRGPSNLHTELLVARSHYGPSEDLCNFIYTSAADIDDFGYRLACLRGLALGSGAQAFPFLPKFIPYINENIHAGQLALLLRGLLSETGYRRLYEWYLDSSLQGHPDWVEDMKVLQEFLSSRVLQNWPAKTSEDPYEILLSVLFRAKHTHLTAEELLWIARLHRHFETISPIVMTLEHAYVTIGKWSKKVAWEFSPLNEYSEDYLHKQRSVIEVNGKLARYDSEMEETVELIFQKVRNRYEDRPKAARARTAVS